MKHTIRNILSLVRNKRVAGVAVVTTAAIAASPLISHASSDKAKPTHVLPSGLPRTCSIMNDTLAPMTVDKAEVAPPFQSWLFLAPNNVAHCDAQPLSSEQRKLPDKLRAIAQPANVHTAEGSTRSFTTGARLGKGSALAVVCPGSLKEAVACLRACASSDVAVITQGRNTGLTGGSVPRDTQCDRPTVIINTLRLNKIQFIGEGAEHALCLSGAGIYDLSVEAKKRGRESHSVLGSIFLNPTVAAGVALGSGGTQMRKGPAYTERALWCKVGDDKQVEVVNTLGFKASSEEELLDLVESGAITEADLASGATLPSSDSKRYSECICKLDSSVSRSNADTRGIGASRSEGKVLILASLHDTFAPPSRMETLWVSCDTLETAQLLKKEVLLTSAGDLPVSCEYMDKDSYDVVDRAGRVACHALGMFGMGSKLSNAWKFKMWFEGLPLPFASILPDKVLWWFNDLMPSVLPNTVTKMAAKKDHHLLISLGEFGGGELGRLRQRLDDFANSQPANVVDVYECKSNELHGITHFRFAAAGAFRTWCVGNGVQGVSIDYALPKDYASNPDLTSLDIKAPLTRMRYSHFGCNVVHEDLAFAPGVDTHAAKYAIKAALEELGGALPAEHGHGTEYHAPPEMQAKWRSIDPTNTMNPGVGGLEYTRYYK